MLLQKTDFVSFLSFCYFHFLSHQFLVLYFYVYIKKTSVNSGRLNLLLHRRLFLFKNHLWLRLDLFLIIQIRLDAEVKLSDRERERQREEERQEREEAHIKTN